MSTLSPAQSINPANGQLLASYAWASADEVAAAIAQSSQGFARWRQTPLADRAEGLRALAAAIRHRAEEMALCITREMGKPVLQARAEVAKSAALCDWYAEHGPAMLATEQTRVEDNKAVIEYRRWDRFWR
jgi:succinate semialdehyde dehydrogenase (EC 1.2.1.16)